MSVKLGVPSKGRLMDKTFDWFGARGVGLRRVGSEREYAGAVEGIDGVELVLLSAGEIPRELAAGRIHLGVTGTDLVQEKLVQWDQKVEPLAELGFGQADLIVAVKQVFALGQLVALTRVKKIYQLLRHDIYHVRLLHCMARSVHRKKMEYVYEEPCPRGHPGNCSRSGDGPTDRDDASGWNGAWVS